MPDEPSTPLVSPGLVALAGAERVGKAGASADVASAGREEEAASERNARNRFAVLYRPLLIALALWCFIIALQLIKSGALGLKPVLDSISGGGILGHLGF